MSSLDQNDSDNDLMSAIKQVAKEMAEAMAVKTSQKLKESINLEEAEKENPIPTKSNISKSPIETEQEEPKGERIVLLPKSGNTRYMEDNYMETSRAANKSFYEREVDAHNNLQHRLELIRNKKIADEMKMYKNKPQLSEKTKKIIKQKLANEKPIYQRSEEVLKQKNEKLQMLKSAYKELEEMEEMEHRSRFNAPGMVDKEVIDNFIQDQFAWLKNKEDKMNFIKNEIEKIENENAKYLYKPAISKTSENLAKSKASKFKHKDVHTRLHNNHEEMMMKKQIMQIKEIPTFTPTINKNIPKFKNSNKNTTGKSAMKTTQMNTGIQPPQSRKERLNKSAMELYSNQENFEENENYDDDTYSMNKDEDPLISQYRLHLAKSYLNSSPVKDLFKTQTKMMSSVATNKIEEDRNNGIEPHWEYEIGKVNERELNSQNKTTEFNIVQERELKSLYSLNVRSTSPWNKSGENKIVATPKFSNVVKNLK